MTVPSPSRPSVVVVGGGFAGFFAARTLERLLPAEAARLDAEDRARATEAASYGADRDRTGRPRTYPSAATVRPRRTSPR